MTLTKTLIVQRTHASADSQRTFGTVTADGKFLCYTLEDQVREIKGQPVASWKVQNQTAIPIGIYSLTLVSSPKFGPDTLSVNNVPGYQYIRMHPGNTELDTDGCLLLGLQINDAGIIGGTSRPGVAVVKAVVQGWIKAGNSVLVDIRQLPSLVLASAPTPNSTSV